MAGAAPAGAQAGVPAVPPPEAPASRTWSIEGEVQVGRRAGPQPVPNRWVVVHRIASDSAGNVSGGPLDSARTDARGRYRIRYRRAADQATYIAITMYQGVSYISSPLTTDRVTGDDALIMVFDTTSPPYPIRVAGRHLVVGAPDADDNRRVVEVFELLNDSTHTVIGTESNPVWRAALPARAENFEINPIGDVSPAMTRRNGEWVYVFAPVSPGLRQISFTYTLGPDAFPVEMPMVDSLTVFEVLVQEPQAVIEGGGLTEVAAVMQEGVPFRRLLAQNVPARAGIRITVPRSVTGSATRGVRIVAITVSLVMLVALSLVFWTRRRAKRVDASPPPAGATDALIRELATMDAEFERRTGVTAEERAEFDARRAALKARLNAALAEPKGVA